MRFPVARPTIFCPLPVAVLAVMTVGGCATAPARTEVHPRWTLDHGAVIRGDRAERRIALIFTGGDYGEGTGTILDALEARGIRASFFVTGEYLRRPEHAPHLRRIVDEGHYLGPHSDNHPLYCDWQDRSKTLVTEAFFRRDLRKNINDLRAIGALPPGAPIYFIPPYEWFNADQVAWARRMGVRLFNFTPGSGSNRDFAPEGHRSFVSAQRIFDDILTREQADSDGLSGFLLLLHLGSQRQDKFHPLLSALLDELRRRGYEFVRVDRLLAE